jgi:hypothetical protein
MKRAWNARSSIYPPTNLDQQSLNGKQSKRSFFVPTKLPSLQTRAIPKLSYCRLRCDLSGTCCNKHTYLSQCIAAEGKLAPKSGNRLRKSPANGGLRPVPGIEMATAAAAHRESREPSSAPQVRLLRGAIPDSSSQFHIHSGEALASFARSKGMGSSGSPAIARKSPACHR